MIKINIEQGSEAWFQCRLGRVTGTRFKFLMSGKSTKGYQDLITEIACEVVSGEIEDTYSNADMERGIELEPHARKSYEDLFSVKVDEVGFCIPDEGNEFADWIGISPDGITEGLQEFKCPKMKTHWRYISSDKLPSEYRWQVQGQLFVSSLPWCDFMSYHPSLKPFVIRVYPNIEDHEAITIRLRETIILVKEEIKNYKQYDHLKS